MKAGGASQGSKLKLTESLVCGTEHVIREQLGAGEAVHCSSVMEDGGDADIAMWGVMSHAVTSCSVEEVGLVSHPVMLMGMVTVGTIIKVSGLPGWSKVT